MLRASGVEAWFQGHICPARKKGTVSFRLASCRDRDLQQTQPLSCMTSIGRQAKESKNGEVFSASQEVFFLLKPLVRRKQLHCRLGETEVCGYCLESFCSFLNSPPALLTRFPLIFSSEQVHIKQCKVRAFSLQRTGSTWGCIHLERSAAQLEAAGRFRLLQALLPTGISHQAPPTSRNS